MFTQPLGFLHQMDYNPFGHVPYQWMLKLHGGWQVCPQRASHENEVAAEADEGGCKTEQKGDPGGGHPGSGLAPDAIGSKTLQWSFDLLGLQLPIWKNAIRQYGVIDQKVRETVSIRADSQTWGRAQESAFSQGLLSSSPSPPPTQGIWGTNCTLINIV